MNLSLMTNLNSCRDGAKRCDTRLDDSKIHRGVHFVVIMHVVTFSLLGRTALGFFLVGLHIGSFVDSFLFSISLLLNN